MSDLFGAFPKIFAIGNPQISEILNGEVEITEKIDGCVTYETLIDLADGTKETIGKIVNNKMPCEVLCYNESTHKIESSKIVNWFKNGKTDDWLMIEVVGRHGQPYHIRCTPDHRIMVNDYEWVRADNIKPGDIVRSNDAYIDVIAKQAICGAVLGDGSVTNGRFCYAHGMRQFSLLEYMSKILYFADTVCEDYISGYNSNCSRIRTNTLNIFREIENIFYSKYGKYVSDELCDLITPISLAWWYMDDGSCSFSAKNQSGYSILHTECFSDKCVLKLSKMLTDKFGIENIIDVHKGKYNVIRLTTESSKLFCALVAPYIIKDMHYKLLPEFRTEYCFWDFYKPDFKNTLSGREVLSVGPYIPNNKTKYDIEVEGHHNYFSNSLLIHNSQISWGKVDGELRVRSKGKEQFVGNPDKLFGPAMDHLLTKERLLKDGFVFYGETLARPRHNVLSYERIPKNHIALFGVRFPDGNMLSSYKFLTLWASMFDIDVVPLLYRGDAASVELLEQLLDVDSYLGNVKVEGVVVKNYTKALEVFGRLYPLMSGKLVSEKFKEKHQKDWKTENTGKGKWQTYCEQYRSEARWEKAVQSLREEGNLANDPRDIGPLLKIIQNDIMEEEEQQIKNAMWSIFKQDLLKTAIRGFPQWYKDKLLDSLRTD